MLIEDGFEFNLTTTHGQALLPGTYKLQLDYQAEGSFKVSVIEDQNVIAVSELPGEASPVSLFFNTESGKHGEVENSLHWTLDVIFREDMQRKRNANAAQNFAIIQKIALNLVKSDKTNKDSLKSRRLRAGWNEKYLLYLLGF